MILPCPIASSSFLTISRTKIKNLNKYRVILYEKKIIIRFKVD
jgi:hypothetical protein